MGAHPYWYFTRYEEDIEAALDKLRQREFEAGRYNPVMPFIEFPIDPAADSPGPQHRSIQHARAAADTDGTRSILDIEGIELRLGQQGIVARRFHHAQVQSVGG